MRCCSLRCLARWRTACSVPSPGRSPCAAHFHDPAIYRRFAGVIYTAFLAVMALVLATGAVTRGSKRWITAGGFTFQPSEFGKLLLALCLAAFVANSFRKTHDLTVALRTIGWYIQEIPFPVHLEIGNERAHFEAADIIQTIVLERLERQFGQQ